MVDTLGVRITHSPTTRSPGLKLDTFLPTFPDDLANSIHGPE